MSELEELLRSAVALAEEAGRAIMRHYASAAAARLKADDTPVTDADLEADRLIVAGLKALTPGIPTISEEGGPIPSAEERAVWRRFWLVDPLDGTKSFVERADDFTVNIGLVEGQEPVLGVVIAPALGETFFAIKDGGSWQRRAGRPAQQLRTTSPGPGEPLTVVESRSHPSDRMEGFLSNLLVKRRIRVGSSLKFCRVAEGAADLYPRFGGTWEWDTAAGDCVYRWSGAAGPRPSPLVYNKPTLRNDDFILGADISVHLRS